MASISQSSSFINEYGTRWCRFEKLDDLFELREAQFVCLLSPCVNDCEGAPLSAIQFATWTESANVFFVRNMT